MNRILTILILMFLSQKQYAQETCIINTADTVTIAGSIVSDSAVCLWRDTNLIKQLPPGKYALLYSGTKSIYCVFNVHNSKLNGEYLSYRKDGRLYGKATYSENKITGIFYAFSINGYPLEITEYTLDKTKGWQITFKNGKPLQAIEWDGPLVLRTSVKKSFVKKIYKARKIDPNLFILKSVAFL